MPIVEMTYPETYPRTPLPLTTPEVETQTEEHTHPAPTENHPPQIVDQPTTDNDSTEAQHGSLSPDNQNEDTTGNVIYHDTNQFWNALKIMRQSTGKEDTIPYKMGGYDRP